MIVKLVCGFVVLCAVIANTHSEKGFDGRPYMRIKRGKYPTRYYRPPVGFPKGAYSYTPPPNYMPEDESPYPGNSRPPKVSRRPYDGLGEEDIQNFVKYLSKQDLDKIIELSGHNRDSGHKEYKTYRPITDEYKSIYNSIQDVPEKFTKPIVEHEGQIFNALVHEIDLDPKFNHQEKPVHANNIPNQVIGLNSNYINNQRHETDQGQNYNNLGNYMTEPTPLKAFYEGPQFSSSDQDINNQVYTSPQSDSVLFTDSKIMPEENLPRPMNLRDDSDFDVSFTNNVPTIVKADSSSYKVENFGVLPLMDYHSKLDSLSSYHVPHYTVTSSKSSSYSPSSSSYSPSSASSYSSHSSSKVPAVEPAPPSSAAKEQSDAHLKAVRIWSHKSKGTAYTLHDDGTLSLERPGRPKGNYGYP